MAVLTAEDVSRLPEAAFAAIMLRSTLHHVLDVARFLADCSRILAPGGVLLFEEPCVEGYVLMGVIAQFLPSVLRSKGIALSAKHLADIRLFADSMLFYARRDLDKSLAEDKHLFRPEEIGRICRGCNMQMEFFPNRRFDDIGDRDRPLPENYFERFFVDYVRFAMSWDAELVGLVEEHAREYLQYFAPLAKNGGLPYTYSTFLCQKPRP
jgi:SAM-dependent methyltransferase